MSRSGILQEFSKTERHGSYRYGTFGTDRSRLLLLPEVVDDHVGPENPVCFIEAFVDQPDPETAGFVRVTVKATGRPGYEPANLLKL